MDDEYKWWAKALLAVLTTIIAAPATGAAVTCGIESRKVAIEEKEQKYKLLDRALDPNREPRDRHAVLRYIVTAGDGSEMKEWAKAELDLVTTEIDTKRMMADLAESAQKLNAQASEYQDNIRSNPSAPEVKTVVSQYQAAAKQLDLLRQQYSEAESKLQPWMRPSGRTFPKNPTVNVTTLCKPETIRGGERCMEPWFMPSSEVGLNLDDATTWSPEVGIYCTCKPRGTLREMLLP